MAGEMNKAQLATRKVVYPSQLDSHHIRLFKLDPNTSSESDFFYSLETFGLTEPPAFSALSYTWGDAEDVEDTNSNTTEGTIQRPPPLMNINNHEFAITQNLSDALVMLRQQEPQSYIWIDAICINQADPVERSLQVSVMDRIYRFATQVIIWLGPDTRQDARTVLELLRKLALWFDENHSKATGFEAGGAPVVISDMLQHAGLPELSERFDILSDQLMLSWKPFMDFFRRRWFFRTWTVQEIVLARHVKVFCGDTEFMWSEITSCCNALRSTGLGQTLGWIFHVYEQVHEDDFNHEPSETAYIPGSTFASTRHLSWLCSETLSRDFDGTATMQLFCTRITGRHHMIDNMAAILTFLLHCTREHQAFESRDKIYGVLGILSAAARVCGEDTAEIEINYAKPVEFAFSEAARYVLRRSNQLGFLTYVHNPALRTLPDLPSWVPDFSKFQHNPLLFIDKMVGTTCFQASNCYSQDIEARPFHPKANTLLCRGYYIGCVTAVSEPLMRLAKVGLCSKRFDLGRQLDDIAEMLLGCPDIYCTGQPRIEVLWRTLIANTEDRSYPASSSMGYSFRHWLFLLIVIVHDTKTDNWFDLAYYKEKYSHYDALAESDSSQTAPNVEALIELTRNMQEPGIGEVLRRLDEKASAFMIASASSMLSWSFCVTDSGHMCLGFESMQPGDSVWIIEGGATPFILRNALSSMSEVGEPGYRQMTLVGEAYVHGVMHGEALEGIEIPWQDIAIA